MDAQQALAGWGTPPVVAPASGAPSAETRVRAIGGKSAATLPPPLDGCVPGGSGRRVVASLLDGLVCAIVSLPLWIGIGLLPAQSSLTVAAVLCGLGVALPLAHGLVMVWLQGSRGITMGTLIMRLRVVREATGAPLGFRRSLARHVVFWALSWLMALSVPMDPTHHRRGFHDRMIGGIVVDVRAGRDPLRPRPDGYERPDASEYLGEAAVPVAVRENLTMRPGAAWSAEEPVGRQSPGEPVVPEEPVITSSPWAPARASEAIPDESTRLARGPEDLGDLEATRLPSSRRDAPAGYRLQLDDGAVHDVRGVVVMGRNPTADVGHTRLVLSDETRSVSQNHLRLEADAEGLLVADLGSTNGSALVLADGTRQELDPHTPISLPDGASLTVGDRTLTVERIQ